MRTIFQSSPEALVKRTLFGNLEKSKGINKIRITIVSIGIMVYAVNIYSLKTINCNASGNLKCLHLLLIFFIETMKTSLEMYHKCSYMLHSHTPYERGGFAHYAMVVIPHANIRFFFFSFELSHGGRHSGSKSAHLFGKGWRYFKV